MKNAHIIIAIAFLTIIGTMSKAQTETQQTGDWSDDCTWDPTPCSGGSDVPSQSDVVNVNHELVLDQNLTVKNDWVFNQSVREADTTDGTAYYLLIRSGGTVDVNATAVFQGLLDVENGGSLTIRDGDTLFVGGGGSEFSNGSTIVIEDGGVLYIEGNFTNNNNSDNVTVNGKIIVNNGTFSNGNGGVISGTGSIEADAIENFNNGGSCIFGNCADAADCTGGGCIIVQPVYLLSFSVSPTENGQLAEWTSILELNNDHYDLEFSENLREWSSPLKVTGAGNSKSLLHYQQFLPADLIDGMNYVRLSQTDFDGTREILRIQSFRFNKEQFSIGSYPNPVSDILNISYSGSSMNLDFTVRDLMGNTLLNGEWDDVQNGDQFQLNTQNFVSGIHLLQICPAHDYSLCTEHTFQKY